MELPRLWLWCFWKLPAMQMAAQRTCENLFSLAIATTPTTLHAQINFIRNSRIFYTRANPEVVISILLFETIKSISHTTKPQCNLLTWKPFLIVQEKTPYILQFHYVFLFNLQAYFNKMFMEKNLKLLLASKGKFWRLSSCQLDLASRDRKRSEPCHCEVKSSPRWRSRWTVQ